MWRNGGLEDWRLAAGVAGCAGGAGGAGGLFELLETESFDGVKVWIDGGLEARCSDVEAWRYRALGGAL